MHKAGTNWLFAASLQ
ncbi:KxYKxGKxW signal peptide domain-containing protein [Acinetobacter sp. HR7]